MDRIKVFEANGRARHKVVNGKRLFKKASYNEGENTRQTPLTVEWQKGVQEEIVSTIEASGIVPTEGKN